MKMKVKNKAAIGLCVLLLLSLISMLGTSLIQSNFGAIKVTTHTQTLSALATEIQNNTAKNGKKVDIQFTQDTFARFSFIVLQPANATASAPAPAIICAHGAYNSKELQMSNYLELAKRGFVVISIDMAGHGHSDPAIGGYTKDTFGMLAATEYAMSLDFVDNSKIGLTGHSLGQMACYNTLAVINKEGSNNHIAAWFEENGTMPAAAQFNADNTKGLLWGILAGKFDEFDTIFFGANNFSVSPVALNAVKLYYPAFNSKSVPEGDWFTSNGNIGKATEGTKIGVPQGVVIYNPAITHPMGHFSKIASALTVRFFYDAFGIPTGANYLSSSSQTWWIAVFFQTLGLIAFFGMMFPLVSLMLNTKLFAGLRQTERVRKDLPSIKSWKEWVPLTLTLLALMLYAFFTFFPYYNQGSNSMIVNNVPSMIFNNSTYPYPESSGLGYWSLCCGIFAIAMICINYGLKRLFYMKDKTALANPFESAKLDNISHFFKILLLVGVITIIMYIPPTIAYYVFQADFRISNFTAGMPTFRVLPIILLKYLPFWIIFYVPNAIFNANTRYKEMPEWASQTICAVANALPLIILIIIQYNTLFSTGKPWDESSGMAGIIAFAIAPCLIFAAVSARYIYKKTGSAWIPGILNATIMCLTTSVLSWHQGLAMFPF